MLLAERQARDAVQLLRALARRGLRGRLPRRLLVGVLLVLLVVVVSLYSLQPLLLLYVSAVTPVKRLDYSSIHYALLDCIRY